MRRPTVVPVRRLIATGVVLMAMSACGSTLQASGNDNSANLSLSPSSGAAGSSQSGSDVGGNSLGSASSGSGDTGNSVTGGNTTGASTGGATSSGTTSTGTTTGSGDGQPTSSTSAAGASPKSPIELGFVVTNVSNAGSFGLNDGSSFTDTQLYEALVAGLNKQGGIDGRQIKGVYAVTDTAGSNYDTQFQAACADFTQDNHVSAVLGYIFEYVSSFESCLHKAGVVHIYGGYQPGDATDQAADPLLFATSNPTGNIADLTLFSGAVKTGAITTKTKLGIVKDTCADDARAFTTTAAPYLASQHITYKTFNIGCATGAGDDGAIVSSVESAELQFRSSGITAVVIDGVPAILFAADAQTQGWHPEYLLTDGGAAYEGAMPVAQEENMHGFGWLPEVDTDPSHQPTANSAAQTRCLALLREEGLVAKQYNDFLEAYTSCDAIYLYADALAGDGGQTAGPDVMAELTKIAPTFAAASTYGGTIDDNGDQRGGPAQWRAWKYSASCSCFEYFGPTYPIPTT